MSQYLTTRELAELLRIKERKVYDLAASGEVPCSRATGKLLFPREAVAAWIAGRSSGSQVPVLPPRPLVFLGSHDPLLEWALRESECAIATYFDGSLDGLTRFCAGEGIAAGLHVPGDPIDGWSTSAVTAACASMPVVLVEWARRRRGLILPADATTKGQGVRKLVGKRLAARQTQSGTHQLLCRLLGDAGIGFDELLVTVTARTESDAATSVLEGKADAAFGLESLARQFGLSFAPIIEERFDLLIERRAWFEPPMQKLLAFCRTEPFRARAREHAGYDLSGFGRVHFNGP